MDLRRAFSHGVRCAFRLPLLRLFAPVRAPGAWWDMNRGPRTTADIICFWNYCCVNERKCWSHGAKPDLELPSGSLFYLFYDFCFHTQWSSFAQRHLNSDNVLLYCFCFAFALRFFLSFLPAFFLSAFLYIVPSAFVFSLYQWANETFTY